MWSSLLSIYSNVGITKAAVLPVPFFALAIKLFPTKLNHWEYLKKYRLGRKGWILLGWGMVYHSLAQQSPSSALLLDHNLRIHDLWYL